MQHFSKTMRFEYKANLIFKCCFLYTIISIQLLLYNYFYTKYTPNTMKHQITKEDLVRDMYGETNFMEKAAIQTAKENDAELQEEFKSLKKAYNLLNSLELQPPSFLIQNILNYSKSSKFEAEAS